jgi:hypothetical protein
LEYAKNLEENIRGHCLIEKMGEAHTLGTSKEDTQGRINLVDKEGKQLMTHAKPVCQKLKLGRICSSPKAVIWIECKQIYCLLREYKLGRNKNWGNLKQAACIQKIKHPIQISMAQLKIHLEVCEERNNFFTKTQGLILQETPAEMSRAGKLSGQGGGGCKNPGLHKMQAGSIFLALYDYVCRKTMGGSPTTVQVEGQSISVYEHVTQASIQEAIWSDIYYKQFYLMEEVPFCNRKLHGEFGYDVSRLERYHTTVLLACLTKIRC